MVNTTTRPQPGTLTAVTARSGYPLSNKALPSKFASPKLPNTRIGTAGWAYPEWNGVVYPQGSTTGVQALSHLARQVDLVEINSSFYQNLRPEIVKLWIAAASVNPDFHFTAKLNRRFTHDRVLDNAEIAAFKPGLVQLQKARKLGALLMQFPWSFRFNAENQDFLIRVRRAFSEFPLVAEMRHSSWLAEEAIGTFLDYRIGFCNIDQPEYTNAMPPTAQLTSAIGYVRLHGRNPLNSLGGYDRGAPAGFRQKQHDYLYTEAELREWTKRIERVSRFAESTFVVFNNDSKGKSVVNALQLQSMLAIERSGANEEAPRQYRRGEQQVTQQQTLFSAA